MTRMTKARHGKHRYLCHYCDWNWPMHFLLPFDFRLASIAHRRHVRRKHTPSNGPPLLYGVDWAASRGELHTQERNP